MGNEMPRTIEQEKEIYRRQSAYNMRVFGTEYPQKERVEAALDRAHEIRKFEIGLYWRRSFFFWGFIAVFLAAFALIIDSESIDGIKPIAAVFLSCMGLFTSIAWLYIEKGSRAWQKNWERHIDFLEDNITGKLHKTVLGKSSGFYSIAGIHSWFIASMIFFWCSIFIFSVCYAPGVKILEYFKNNDTVTLILISTVTLILISIVLSIIIFGKIFLGPEGKWRSSKRTIPRGIYHPDDNAIHKRELIKLADKPHHPDHHQPSKSG